jgi:hypothetical protein
LYLNFFPLPFVTTITSVSLINRGMFSLLILFFYGLTMFINLI